MIDLDYRTCDDKDIDNAIESFVNGEVEKVSISNIHPSIFERRYDMEIDDENGFDMDWWGHFHYNEKRVGVFGCCRYGYITIEKDDEDEE